MSISTMLTYNYACPIDEIEMYFKYNNSIVHSAGKRVVAPYGLSGRNACEVKIVTKCVLEDYDSAMEAARYSRSELLVILDIISFFIGNSMTVYDSNEVKSEKCSDNIDDKDNNLVKLKICGVDYTQQLIVLIERLKSDTGLLVSMLDRWRKADYLTEQSNDANLLHDEAILSYFHILELFGENYGKELKNQLDNNMSIMLQDYFEKNYFLDEIAIENKVIAIKKIVGQALMDGGLTLASKVKYFLKKVDLLDANLSYFIDTAIGTRNSIAHGRITFQKKLIYPLPPFFCLAKDSYDILDMLKFLTGRMIAIYIGIDCWRDEWNEARKYLLPPKNVIKKFFENPELFQNLNSESLCKGNKEHITWNSIFNHYVKEPRKFKIDLLQRAVGECFLETIITEENGYDIFNISVILCDSSDEKIKSKAIDNVNIAINRQWHGWSNHKDALRFLDYHDIEVVWYKNYLEDKAPLL